MAVCSLALISSRPAGYRCGIRLRCGSILLRPNLFTPGVVSLRYSASLYFSGVLQGVVAAPVHGGREIGLWREIIDCMEKNLQTSYCTLPLYFSFPLWNHSLPARLTQFLHLTL